MDKEIDDVRAEVNGVHSEGSLLIGAKASELSKSAENVSAEHRIKRRARRATRQSSKDGITNGSGGQLVEATRRWKNTRRPRNKYGRGLPKKGGAGGKGVWGKLGSEIEDMGEDMDTNDPNYDSDSLENGDIELKTIIPEASDEELKKCGEAIILEYFEHGDTREAELAFEELHVKSKGYMIPLLAVEIAFDHKPSHREMTSVLISDMYSHLIKQRDITIAFDILLKNLPDLILDTPDAPTLLGNFLARAVADDCLPPKVIEYYRSKVESDHAVEAVRRAETLLSMKHGLVRLDNVWGIGGALRPVKYLIRQMNLLLQEYLSSEDTQEATRCLLELEVPHFHHELVYEAVVMVLESINSHVEEKMCKLLKTLSDAIIITPDMMERGFIRVFDDLPDIIIDVPLAGTVLERFVEQCQKAGFLTEAVTRRMPTRGRKRFVSEGDGGLIKDHRPL
ncbi:programmed cell death 4 [Lycorma delicatula]|uniref:programmed cell death 4 n=1 Tax=Lycorma delicatula TaxID=130591 RepID=UPI003F518B29